MSTLKNQAIQTALTGDWRQAIRCNEELLQDNPSDIDTLNRLAFAYMSSGDKKKAKSLYEQVLGLDKLNPIASRNIKRLTELKDGFSTNSQISIQVNNLFIEEPGKTKVIELVNTADKKILSHLRSGEELELSIKRMKVFVSDSQKQFIGMLPDDVGNRLIKFMNGGNSYEAYLRTSVNGKAFVFIREINKAKRFKDQASFASFDKAKLSLKTIKKRNSE